MLQDVEVNQQAETFIEYFKRLNPHQSLKDAFDFWVGTKDFSLNEKEMIWKSIREKGIEL